MKTKLLVLLVLIPLYVAAQAPGQWAWMSGSNVVNYMGNFGAQGVADPANQPPALYEACDWTDKAGNFWLYGGQAYNKWKDDLWKYSPGTNKWTWIKGHNDSDEPPVYGTLGVPALSNTPGERVCSYSWADNNGNLWLFGGIGYLGPSVGGGYNDLWKYDISSDMWTWMQGDSGYFKAGNFGLRGVEASSNHPASTTESGISWTDEHGNLWLLDHGGCMWKYRTATNNWIWMKGNPINDTFNPYPNPVYGTQGVFDSANTPGFNYFDYTRWIDSKGNLWYLRGEPMVLWEYDIATNMWAWIYGDTATPATYYGLEECVHSGDDVIEPRERLEARACWTDNCDNLWVMGGSGYYITSNDLIYFDMKDRQWIWAGNDTVQQPNNFYGTKGVPSPLCKPASRTGALPFKDMAGNLWLFGGANCAFDGFYADLWRYTIDTGCTKCHIVTGVPEVENLQHAVLYPNPATAELNISANCRIATLCISNLLGQEIYTHEFDTEKVRVDVHDLAAGVYLIKINGTEVKKFVKE